MKWFPSLCGCGQLNGSSRPKSKGVRQESQIASEPTRLDEPIPVVTPETSNSAVDDLCTVAVHKDAGEVLGLKLFLHSLSIQSIQPESAVSKYTASIPMGGSICSVNGKPATVRNIRNLLRECRYLTDVFLVIRRGGEVQVSRVSQHRLSHSSATGSSSLASPTASQLSSLWRRVSETATLPQSEGTGVVPIDFQKLSKDSIGMWTRGIVRDTSLPALPTAIEDTSSFDEEFRESPSKWRERRRRAKRASWSGSYPEDFGT